MSVFAKIFASFCVRCSERFNIFFIYKSLVFDWSDFSRKISCVIKELSKALLWKARIDYCCFYWWWQIWLSLKRFLIVSRPSFKTKSCSILIKFKKNFSDWIFPNATVGTSRQFWQMHGSIAWLASILCSE